MAQPGRLQKIAKAKGISVRALLIDAVDDALDYEDAATKLGITRQGLLQALARNDLDTRWIKHLRVVTVDRSAS